MQGCTLHRFSGLAALRQSGGGYLIMAIEYTRIDYGFVSTLATLHRT